MSLIFSTFFFFTMDRSVGQGNLFSHVRPYSPSIVTQLHYRALTGKSLNLAVHQHLGYKLHLVWDSINKSVISERGIEKDVFPHTVTVIHSVKNSLMEVQKVYVIV